MKILILQTVPSRQLVKIEFNRNANLESLKKKNFKVLYKNRRIPTSKLKIIDGKI